MTTLHSPDQTEVVPRVAVLDEDVSWRPWLGRVGAVLSVIAGFAIWPVACAAAQVDGRWQAGIGDPSAQGWITVAVYMAACALSVAAALHCRQAGQPSRFWWVLAGLLLGLGLNKQLDLQSWFTELGRDMALRQGWYAQRAKVQLAFITTMAGVCLAGLVLLRWHLGVMWRCYRLTCLGLALLAAFVVIRAASFHHVDAMLHQRWGPLSGNGLLENGALFIIMLGAGLVLRGRWRRRRPQRGAADKSVAKAA